MDKVVVTGSVREVNSGGYIPRRAKRWFIYLVLSTNPERDSCFSIYQNNGMRPHFICKDTIQCKPFFYL